MKPFNGKAIYNPSGKAGEYSQWACNFYAGCSNGCEYCYLTKGWSAKTYEHRYPKLKAHFKNEDHALEVFEKELFRNIEQLLQSGLFFSFTTDPMLPETINTTWEAMNIALNNRVPVTLLTKCTDWVNRMVEPYTADGVKDFSKEDKKLIAIGFTLTGHDELEPNASTNAERIRAMWKLHNAGFKTWASIEPIIDFGSSYQMIANTIGLCDLFKIGIKSGGKYKRIEVLDFVAQVYTAVGDTAKIYFKDSLLKLADIDRDHELPANCVDADYNIFR